MAHRMTWWPGTSKPLESTVTMLALLRGEVSIVGMSSHPLSSSSLSTWTLHVLYFWHFPFPSLFTFRPLDSWQLTKYLRDIQNKRHCVFNRKYGCTEKERRKVMQLNWTMNYERQISMTHCIVEFEFEFEFGSPPPAGKNKGWPHEMSHSYFYTCI